MKQFTNRGMWIWLLSDFSPAIFIRGQEVKFWNSEQSYFEPRNLTPASLSVECEGKRKTY